MSRARPARMCELGAFHCQDRGEKNKTPALAGVFEIGGANRNRTDDLLHAMQALSQLSYGPTTVDRLRPVSRPDLGARCL